jgi:hypothetical protein
MAYNPNQFPSAAPIFGFPMTTSITDVIVQSYKADSTDANGYAITPSDVTVLTEAIGVLLLGTAGDVNVVTVSGSTVLLPSLAAGVLHRLPFRVKQVLATGTTADGITGLTK